MRHRWLAVLVLAAPIFVVAGNACVVEETSPAPTGAGGAAAVSVAAPQSASSQSASSAGGGGGKPCGSAEGTLDKSNLVELSYDSGAPKTNLRQQDFKIDIPVGNLTHEYVFNKIPVWEAVRFQLDRPARIHGFEVQVATPQGMAPDTPVVAGLYGDFGYNGFDFWAPDPLWTGDRCAADAGNEGTWLSYTLPTPIEVKDPGLVYVAHLAQPSDPVWWFDANVTPPACAKDTSQCCQHFVDCQSAFNLPNAEKTQYYNGLSFPFQYHFMVRLYVEYTDQVLPQDRIFQPAPNSPTSDHVAWGDYDNDGFDDLLLHNHLYHNKGDGTFEDVTQQAGLANIGPTGGVFGDYDNDGCLDIFFFTESYSTGDYLMHSKCDGTFEDVTLKAGLDDTQNYNFCGDPKNNTHTPSAAAAWFDLDADGKLDLYVANFICWADYTYYVSTVFHNNGDGTFTNLTGKNGFSDVALPSRGVAPADGDGDGWTDLFVNNYVLIANEYFHNNKDGTVNEIGMMNGAAGTETTFAGQAYYGHTIGAAWGDIDNDGNLDIIAANLAHPRFFNFADKTNVLINDGMGNFHDIKGDFKKPVSAAGLRYQETHSVPLLADFDQDGNLDLVITAVYDGRPTDFYWGQGNGHFTLDSFHAGITTTNGWGVAAADYDHDGDMDVFATTLFTNDEPANKKGHWLQVKVTGVKANRSAIGSTVKVIFGGKTRVRHVEGGSGKGGQDSLYLHFGLGDATLIDEIDVVFPGGKVNSFKGPISADQRVWLTEDNPTPKFGWAPPQ